MIISPPLIINEEQIDLLIDRATQSLDEAMSIVKGDGLWEPAQL
jgi:putrescine aminotransferase